MTRDEFNLKHKKNVKLGFDTTDGVDVWREFTADLDELLKSEREACAKEAQDWGYDDKQDDTSNALYCADEIAEKIRRGGQICLRCKKPYAGKVWLSGICEPCFTSNA